MLTLDDYFMGRELLHPTELTPGLRRNAACTVERTNALLRLAGLRTCAVNSGWRPTTINAAIANASPRSRHVTCQAVDLCDEYDALDAWCMANLPALEAIGLWLEHPSATPGWCHLQTVPPGSGNRVFFP